MAFASPQRLRLQIVIAVDNAEGQVTDLRKFLHITQPDETISTLATEVDEKFKKLYPAERPITILRIQDDSGCDLDPAFQLLDVFEERGVARVIISDDGDGVRRFHSPASQLRHLQRNDHPRRESFDSVTGYVTPSVSSLNTASPMQNRINIHRPVALESNGIGESIIPLTEDALEKMQIEHSSRSPKNPSPSPMSPNERKRKRSNEREIPGTPPVREQRPGKKRAVSKSVEIPEITDSQEANIVETQDKDRKRKTSPSKEVEPAKKTRNTRNRKPEITEKKAEEKGNKAKKEDEPVTEEKVRKKPEPAVVITKKPTARKQSIKQPAAVKGQPRSEVVTPVAVPAPVPETTTKNQDRPKKNVPELASESAPASPTVEFSNADNTSTKSREQKGVTKPKTPAKANPWSAEPKTKDKQPPKRTTAKASKESPVRQPEPKTKAISTRKRAAKSKSPDVSSATSQSQSSKNSVEEEPGTSLTSQSSEESGSSSESEDKADVESSKDKDESESESEESDSSSDSSSDESDSEDKMEVDSVKDKSAPARSSPAVSTRRSVSPMKKGKQASKSASKGTDVEDKDVSRSPSPTDSASSSSSRSGDSSDSDSSDSESSASDEASVDNADSASKRSASKKSDDAASESDSESSDSDSSKSSASSSSSKRRSASPAASAGSNKSSAQDGNSSTSSQLVARSLGGQTSAQKSQPVNPILNRVFLSQTSDRSPNQTSLSQQSPLAKHGSSMLKRWTSLTDMAASMKSNPVKNVIAKGKGKEDDASAESGSDSDSEDSSSDEEEKEGYGIPKAKLAGRAPVAKKKSSGGLRALFK